ncbi:MAG: hypothetical protein FWC64_08955 [Treponema sp.]|nr:hypothetical protein [Treponema sp.]
MKKRLTAILAGFIATAGLYAQTTSFDEGYWIAPAPVLSATPLPSLFFPDDAALDNAPQPMQAGTAVEWPPPMFSVGLTFTVVTDLRLLGSITIHEERRTWSREYNPAQWSMLGIGAFFDARYAKLAVGLSGGFIRWWQDDDEYLPVWARDTRGYFFALDFRLLFKFPLELPLGLPLGGYFFPLLGVGYNVVFSFPFTLFNTLENPSHFNTFRIPFGIGLDLPVGNNTFLRTSLLGHYTFAPRHVRDLAAAIHGASHSGDWGGVPPIFWTVN